MVTLTSPQAATEAVRVTYVTADEAFKLLQTELDRLLALLPTLSPDDWSRPTACSEWNVRDMVAHQAGSYASGTGYREMIRQYRTKPDPGQLREDAINALQVAERTKKTPEQLIAEIHRDGPIAIHKWAYQFRLIKLLSVPHPVPGKLSLRHLMWVIHSRDAWIHRLDICRATGKPFEQTIGHDDRIEALVMLEAEIRLSKILHNRAAIIELTGVSGGEWKVGNGDISTVIQMDAIDFNLYASGRYSYEEALGKAGIQGDRSLAEQVLKNTQVLY